MTHAATPFHPFSASHSLSLCLAYTLLFSVEYKRRAIPERSSLNKSISLNMVLIKMGSLAKIAKSSSPKKLIECSRIFFWQNIMEPFMTPPDKKINSFCQPPKKKQVWSEEEINVANLCLHIN
jgi:hypothetical protein